MTRNYCFGQNNHNYMQSKALENFLETFEATLCENNRYRSLLKHLSMHQDTLNKSCCRMKIVPLTICPRGILNIFFHKTEERVFKQDFSQRCFGEGYVRKCRMTTQNDDYKQFSYGTVFVLLTFNIGYLVAGHYVFISMSVICRIV